ncbi:MAG: S-methyl-5-thioribose-1-phosphate isomerase [Deltaproteobacteria bacterium]|nr:S-methyl-5-thioribose-1-phosphate isomerase [Deltaproteobacteria bacterium]MBW1958109.1 S-methyl-5-thioribose-1-phosphate isomerase [Deltaproteobacteria bacterium]MBW2013470.1 S-methyl-5-thioribose-1-phosphate isomerase [Deltaproteobacteria bacterium]MBW2090307.1 S-methyl-5-thioribose-1-phosphate isomerase [Deltaproteobacteria bacterium]
MKVDGKNLRPIWLDPDLNAVKIIDQRRLPHEFVIADLKTVDDVITAIKEMYVRGAPLIGVTAAYGVYLAALNSPVQTLRDKYLIEECKRLKAARPTAVNLSWAVDKVLSEVLTQNTASEKIRMARKEAEKVAEAEAENCRKIGEHGLRLIHEISKKKQGDTVNLLTHCNAGWLACIEYGTATAPIYAAFNNGIDVHVWVDETRPLNQGSRLTAWELGKHGVKHTVIADNAGGHLMQHGRVDMVIVGTDRSTFTGDVANKIGTYLKALAARDNNIPFYVALPSSTFDWNIKDGIKEIPIEERNPDEIRYVQGLDRETIRSVLIPPKESPAANFAFDVTPAKLVSGFITERGVCKASEKDILNLFPEKRVSI